MTTPTLIQDLNLSQSYLRVLKKFDDISGKELSPLVLTKLILKKTSPPAKY